MQEPEVWNFSVDSVINAVDPPLSLQNIGTQITDANLIGLECETGNVDDCATSSSGEVVTETCRGVSIFSTEPINQKCGDLCNKKRSLNEFEAGTVKAQGWTQFMRYFMNISKSVFIETVQENFYQFIFSIDNSSGTGDHENWMLDDEILYQVSPKSTYTDCKRIAVNVRSKENHRPWHTKGLSQLKNSKFV